MERYKYRGSFGIGLLSNGGEVRKFWISSKALWQSLFHSNFLAFFKAQNSGKHFLTEHEMNRPSAVILPLSFWGSFKVLGAFILRMASIFFGFASMPLCEIINPKNFPAFTPNTHLSGLSLILYLSNVSSIFSRSLACYSDFWLLTMMSSIYTSIFLPTWSCSTWFISRWYIAPAFFSPKGMTL